MTNLIEVISNYFYDLNNDIISEPEETVLISLILG